MMDTLNRMCLEARLAHYHRFEVYLPLRYRVSERDPATDAVIERSVETNPATLARFQAEAVDLFGGATNAHPSGPPPFLGMWSDEKSQIAVDDVTYLFVLVPAARFQDALDFFETWRRAFLEELNQDAILVMHWPVETLGEIT